MKETAEYYERLVDEENDLLDRIETCDAYMNAILEYTYREGQKHHKLTVEGIVTAVYAISSDLRTELVHVQLEKAVLSCEMRQSADK